MLYAEAVIWSLNGTARSMGYSLRKTISGWFAGWAQTAKMFIMIPLKMLCIIKLRVRS